MATRAPLEIRFWSKVDKRGPDECWLWTGPKATNGYGRIRLTGGRVRPAHQGKYACHSCDNPPCVNPAHIWQGDARDNNRDCVRKGRHHLASKTHCKRGHPLSGDNLLITSHGHRNCRLCKQQWEKGRTFRRQLARRAA